MAYTTSSEVRMTKKIENDAEVDVRFGRRVNREVSVLLSEIEKEPVPDRLLQLAQELQKALSDKFPAQNS
ncbi:MULTISPECIES: hypothetical protein [Pseudorhizobium]|jgi:hypothetical protein|nr:MULTISPECIES: hypothetical protein [Pseudorhizobium]MBU1316892.1 hypothetical protein [Alphaproteobacteria bacterium]MDY6961933.1 hypothetical protein [Pseudomonadota bacterium]MBU1548189.1 hypothetical protein [Alphaproteobacteria bacterium]MBU2336049.1 hypothetical protein [Alphaproteobacteria bacterium]MBU2390556.1 hypothetical protein [Alphaproteobacteria bacterium]